MFSMFRQLFTALTVFFSSFEKCAVALDCLATVGKEMAEGYLDETRIERQVKITELQKQLKVTK